MAYTKIVLPYRLKAGILALGAQSKSAFCFAKGNTAYLSDSMGDLGNAENFKKFDKSIKNLRKKLKIKPDIIACDLHPAYTSTGYAHDLAGREKCRVKGIQHHEAHVAGCMADNNIKGRVIGIAFDGTGFGPDGMIWGGEFFTGTAKGFKRAAHLKYIPMPGAEAAVREPRRMAFSYLYDIFGKNAAGNILTRLGKEKASMLAQMIDKKINSPLTSSMGRLFDAVSSLAGICDFAGHEGEAAVKLEKIINDAGREGKGSYRFRYKKDEGGIVVIDWRPVIKGVVKDLRLGVGKPEMSLKFHNAVRDMIIDVCKALRKRYKIKNVCMSGGVFQNRYLINSVKSVLGQEGFKVYSHRRAPSHDGCIPLGQAALAGV